MNPAATAIAGTLLILACDPRGGSRADTHPSDSASGIPKPMTDSTFRARGTIHAVNLEGGCWRFDAEDGRHFELSTASPPAGVLADGKQATLALRPRPDLMSTCMIGPIAEIVTAEP